MKKVMWMVAMIPAVVTSFVFQFLPDSIPMHYDLEGNIDRWGNKAESFILPVVILTMTMFWNLLIYTYEKKSVKAETEKEQMDAKSNAKVLSIVGVSQAVMFSIMHFVTLFASYRQAMLGGEKETVDIARLTCALCGIMFMVLGNYMTRTKNNSAVGLRTTWSRFNDITWKKSNRFSAIGLIIAGLLTVITTAFAGGMTSTILMLVYLLLTTLIAVVYSKMVYDQEKNHNK